MSAPTAMGPALEPIADPAWVIDQHGFDPLRDSSRQSRFAVSNGFLGVRGGRAINRGAAGIVPPRTYVAGLFDPGLAVRLRVLRLVSLSERAIGLQLIQLEVEEGDFEITLNASFEGLDLGLKAELLEQDLGVWRPRSSGKRLAMACASSLRVDGQGATPGMPGPFRSVWTWRTRPGQVACFERMVAVTRDDTQTTDPGGVARATLVVQGTAHVLGRDNPLQLALRAPDMGAA